jgi:enoyl-CoA hydratase/carnithine racemase
MVAFRVRGNPRDLSSRINGASMDQFIIFEKRGAVAVITFNRPYCLNAWHTPMRGEITERLKECNNDPEVRAVVMTGAGERAFCAGQDLNETKAIQGGEGGVAWSASWPPFYDSLRGMEKPVVAALNGLAAGSAFQWAMMCDVRVGHGGVTMGQPEINSGIASTLGPWLMIERIGWSRMVELTLTGRMMDAAECHHIGLIHHLARPSHVMAKSLEVAEDLAAKPPIAMKLNKRHFRALSEPAYQFAVEAGRGIQREAYASGEPQAWMAKFFAERERRKRK